jgi:hypothetical protein
MKFSAVLLGVGVLAIAISATTAAPSVSDDESALQAVESSDLERRGGGGSDHSSQCQWGNKWYDYGEYGYCPPHQNCKWYSCKCTKYGWKDCYNQCYWDHQDYNPGDHYNNPTECKSSDHGSPSGSYDCGYYCTCKKSGEWYCEYTTEFDKNYNDY